jgi:hypothetical protein
MENRARSAYIQIGIKQHMHGIKLWARVIGPGTRIGGASLFGPGGGAGWGTTLICIVISGGWGSSWAKVEIGNKVARAKPSATISTFLIFSLLL